MAQVKLAWLIIDFLGIPISILGIVTNLDNIKSAILSILGIIYLGVRIYYYVVDKDLSRREKEIDLWNKEQDKIDRLKKVK